MHITNGQMTMTILNLVAGITMLGMAEAITSHAAIINTITA